MEKFGRIQGFTINFPVAVSGLPSLFTVNMYTPGSKPCISSNFAISMVNDVEELS